MSVGPRILNNNFAAAATRVCVASDSTSGVDVGLYRTWALYWAATRPECSTYCSHDEVRFAAVRQIGHRLIDTVAEPGPAALQVKATGRAM